MGFIGKIHTLFCKHDYEEIEKCNVYWIVGDKPIGTRWTFMCKKCGDIKVFENF